MQALSLGERTRQDIESLRDTYRSAARRGAVLYFSLVQMSSINTMVCYERIDLPLAHPLPFSTNILSNPFSPSLSTV